MIIDHIDIFELRVDLLYPIRIPLGTQSRANNVAIRITTNTGIIGWGESSPFPPITGDSQFSNFETAKQLAQLIKGKDPLAVDARMAEICRTTVGEPSIRSAFDIALFDILAKKAELPLYQLLGGARRELRTDMTIGMQDTVEDTEAAARRVIENGFDIIKLKVGRAGLEDVQHVTAVRNLAGDNIVLKIDSNQGWDFPTAVANIRAMQCLNLQYAEQPVAAWDIENLARLRRMVATPICADESVFDDKDALHLVKTGAVDYINIKLGKSGGIRTALKINAVAESAGCKCMIGCFAESRLALSAAAHVALACSNIVFLDLDSAYDFKSDPVEGGLVYDPAGGGLIAIPDAPGHGAAFDERQLNTATAVTV